MQEKEETFEVVVNINRGLEPLTFTIIAYDETTTPEHVLAFKVSRDKETLGTLQPDEHHCWHLVDGEME